MHIYILQIWPTTTSLSDFIDYPHEGMSECLSYPSVES